MSPSSAWKKQPDGSWLQAYDGMEKYFFAISAPEGQPTPFMIGSRVAFSYSGTDGDIEAILRAAWVEMRSKQPTIAAEVTEGGKLYKPANEAEIHEWLQVSFQTHEAEDDPESCFSRFRQVPRIILHYFPRSRELLLQACHVLVDGIGILYFWNEFFSTLASRAKSPDRPGFDSEHLLLPPVTTELLGVPSTSSEAGQKRANELVGHWAGQTYSPSAAGVPVVEAGQPPADTYLRRELRIPRPTTESIVQACKQRGYTVTCAWQAAVILALRRQQQQQHANPQERQDPTYATATVTMNLRPYFPRDFDPHKDFVAAYYITMPFDVAYDAEASSFERLARHNSTYFKNTLTPESGDLEMIPAYLDLFIGATKAEAAPPVPSSAPVLSSLGIIDRYLESWHGPWQIIDFWLADTTTTEMSLVFLWTWNGEMVLSMSPNAKYMTNDMADRFLVEVRDALVEGLGV